MIGLTVFLSTCITAALCGLDYVAEVNQRQDVVKSRNEAVQWLLFQRNKDRGWGTRDFPETHRTLTAISLSGEMQNETANLEYQLSVKQLELELSLALLRSEGQISAGQLGLYANALLATCRDPNNFYGHNIVKKMRPMSKLSLYAEALVSLAVCNSGNLLTKKELLHYFDILDKFSNQSHVFPDTKAMVVLALSSAMRSYRHYRFIEAHLRQPLKSFKKSQRRDGSFGNIYSSALVIQALIAARDKGEGWSFQKGVDYLLSQQKKDGSFGDLLATYFVLPVLAGKSLVDLRSMSCNTPDNEVYDLVEDELWRGNISVRYSVWGNTNISDVFIVPENSTFFDVMEVAQKMDHRYRFTGTSSSWGFFVQTIGDITNDVACNKYWFLYKVNRETGEIIQTEYGVSKEIPENGDHYIFWYMKSPYASFDKDRLSTCEDNQQDDNTIISTIEVNTDSPIILD